MKYLPFAIVLIFVFVSGCIKRPFGDSDVEVSTVEDQALEDVSKSSTDFMIDFYQNSVAWERAQSFFDYYLKQPGILRTHSLISNANIPGGPFEYTVTRQPGVKGVYYSVKCVPSPFNSAKVPNAIRNARNFARFIKDGTLERSLLVLR